MKLFARAPAAVEPRELIPIFHRWIQRRLLEELAIDVADYGHLHHGPGVLLICHGAQYALDRADGRLGLLHRRRRDPAAPLADRLLGAARAALTACRHLELEPALSGRLRFAAEELELHLEDRLLAPASPATLAAHGAALEALGRRLYGDGACAIASLAAPGRPFGVALRAAGPLDAATLLGRL